jgi:hypothetical protein
MRDYAVGDKIVYRMAKVSSHPTLRAQEIHPAERGEGYSYHVLKYWTVAALPSDGQLIAVTRTGKRHQLACNDPLLRKATLVEKLLHRHDFPRPTAGADAVRNGKSTPSD